MNASDDDRLLDRSVAQEYASWFKALADPTRVQVVALLARAGEPLTVGQVVDAIGVAQSTVSHHLKALAEVSFVLAEPRGTSTLYRINDACVSCFPSAADVVMGRPAPTPPTCEGTTPVTDTDPRRATVARYSGLARIAVAGGTPIDACDPGTDCYGAARYDPDTLAGVPDAARRAGLGCGNPHAVADIGPGDTVLDLGSGGGLDLILSARRTGPTGHAYGLDASPDMRALAETNLAEAGVTNATLLDGHIEAIPLPDSSVDVVISNCVVNLSPDKAAVLAEAHRVLRPGGRLGLTDLVADTSGDARHDEAGRLLTTDAYRTSLAAAGFTDVEVTVTHPTGDSTSSAIVRASKGHGPANP